MDRKYLIANAVLWAAGIIASAVVGAPIILSVVVVSLLLGWRKPATGGRGS